MMSKSIILSNNKPDFTTNIQPPITLDPSETHEIALIGLDMYNSIPNIDENNNTITYEFIDVKENTVPDTAPTYLSGRHTINIPTGSYEIDAINDHIQSELESNGHSNIFELSANLNTFKCIINIKNENVIIDFTTNNSIGSLLGYGKVIIQGEGEHISSNIVNILSVNSILVHCSLVEGSFLNDERKPIIYSFFPNVAPGYKIVENPQSPIFLPVDIRHIDKIRIWLTNENGRSINIRGEKLTVRLHLRSYK